MWTADFVTDPDRDHALCIEIADDKQIFMTIRRNDEGELVVVAYPSTETSEVPASWLRSILENAEHELPAMSSL
jgi:hypothetical protein